MERRTFIRTACTYCLTFSASASLTGALSSCAPIPMYVTRRNGDFVAVPLSRFAESDVQIIRADGFEYAIALGRMAGGDFVALLLACTHFSNQLTPSGNGYACNVHGSTFDKQGRVLRGPAEHPLKKLKTNIYEDNIIISLNEGAP